MALNYSHRQLCPMPISEDHLSPFGIVNVNGYLMEGIPEKNGDGYSRSWLVNQVAADERNLCAGRGGHCYSPESTTKDIADLLPSDPFGMDIETTFTAITGWLEDLEADYRGYMKSNSVNSYPDGYSFFAEWNLSWNNALRFKPVTGTIQLNQKLNPCMQSFPSGTGKLDEERDIPNMVDDVCGEKKVLSAGLVSDSEFQKACSIIDTAGSKNGNDSIYAELPFGEEVDTSNTEAPHEALGFALSYLGVKDLLSAERVCKSFSYTIRSDPLLWMTIHIDKPLNRRITDDVLRQLAGRAQGNLQCLSLVECTKVTDDALRHILEANPRLTKLSIPGCAQVTVEGVVNCVRAFNFKKKGGGIKHLRIGGIYGVDHEHFQELMLLLGADTNKPGSYNKHHFYHQGNFYLPVQDDRALDIEMCPSCEEYGLVYDCPSEGCKIKDKSSQVCRACTLCIARCARCGRCINATEFEETFCLQLLCLNCFKQLVKYHDKLDKKIDPVGPPREPCYDFNLHP